MDELLAKQLEEVKKRVMVYESENPVMNITDAIRVGERCGVLYRWASNGGTYQLRWSAAHEVKNVMESQVCEEVCKRIIQVIDPSTLASLNPGQEPLIQMVRVTITNDLVPDELDNINPKTGKPKAKRSRRKAQ